MTVLRKSNSFHDDLLKEQGSKIDQDQEKFQKRMKKFMINNIKKITKEAGEYISKPPLGLQE